MRKTFKSIGLVIVFIGALYMAIMKSCVEHPERPGLGDIPAVVTSLDAASLRNIIFIPPCASPPCKPPASDEKRVRAIREYVEISRKSGKEIDLSHADLIGLNLSGLNLSFANLTDAKLGDCSQYDDNLGRGYSGTAFRGANLAKAILIGAYLCGADFSEANLEGAKYTKEQIESAKGDMKTHLDSETKRPSHWSEDR